MCILSDESKRTKAFHVIINTMSSLSKRILIFVLLFIAMSGLIGYWVIGTQLLYPFYFYIYGNMGKVLLLSGLAFLYLVRGRKLTFDFGSPTLTSYILILSSLLLTLAFYPLSKMLLTYQTFDANVLFSLLLHVVLILSVVFLFLGVFSVAFIKWLFVNFKHELVVCSVMAVALYSMVFQVWKLWPYFSHVVLQVVYAKLSLTFDNVTIIEPLILRVNNFSILVGQACSGLDSLFLFTALYWFFGIVDWREFNKTRLILAFFPAALGLFAINILRIYLLVLIGALWSPKLALGLFHTYAGLILFMVYFLVFWKLAMTWLKTK